MPQDEKGVVGDRNPGPRRRVRRIGLSPDARVVGNLRDRGKRVGDAAVGGSALAGANARLLGSAGQRAVVEHAQIAVPD